jgi:hypothetical protein
VHDPFTAPAMYNVHFARRRTFNSILIAALASVRA